MRPLPQLGTPWNDRGHFQAMLMWKPETVTGFIHRVPTLSYGCIQRNGIRGQFYHKQHRSKIGLCHVPSRGSRDSWNVNVSLVCPNTGEHDCDGTCKIGRSGKPHCTMKFTVRMNYALTVDAVSPSDAESKVASLIQKQPRLAIRGVDSKYKNMSIWKMFLFG
jgi:hypothetical protein